MLPPTVVSRTNHSIAKTRPSAKSCARCALMCPLRKRSTEVDHRMEVEILDGVLATNHLVLHRACPSICEWQTAKHCSLLSSLQTDEEVFHRALLSSLQTAKHHSLLSSLQTAKHHSLLSSLQTAKHHSLLSSLQTAKHHSLLSSADCFPLCRLRSITLCFPLCRLTKRSLIVLCSALC